MNTNIRHLIFLLILVSVTGCLPDREIIPPVTESGVIRNLRPGLLRINEVFPTGVDTASEKVDWIELWNTSDSIVELSANQFLVSDKSNPSSAYASARSYQIPPKGFFVVYLQNGGVDNSTSSILNPNASLSSNGEFAGIWFLSSSGDTILVDSLSFPASPDSKKSYGRVPNGGNSLKWLKDITRNQSNNVNIGGSGPLEPYEGMFIINEIAPNESPDWVEFYNPLTQNFTMKSGRWFFTDDLSSKTKDTLKVDFVLSPSKHYVVDCNDPTSPSDANQIRAKIKLSSTSGESFGIYYKDDNGQIITIAEQTFPAGILAGKSYGRQPDKTGPFVLNINQSKGLPNP